MQTNITQILEELNLNHLNLTHTTTTHTEVGEILHIHLEHPTHPHILQIIIDVAVPVPS